MDGEAEGYGDEEGVGVYAYVRMGGRLECGGGWSVELCFGCLHYGCWYPFVWSIVIAKMYGPPWIWDRDTDSTCAPWFRCASKFVIGYSPRVCPAAGLPACHICRTKVIQPLGSSRFRMT